jgi:hypothetical protein
MLDLSIIIITRNNKKILDECIHSIKNNIKSITYEIIVSDNNSSDGTQALIKTKHSQVTLIANTANLGFSAANNKGLKIAKGRYSVILNDDTYIKEDTFGKVVRYMDNDPKIGICGPKLLNPDGSLQHQGSIFSAFKWRSKKPIEVSMVLGACMFIRMSMLGKIGLFDENLFFYNDDLDLCKRSIKAGFKVLYFPDAQVHHYGGFSSKRSPDNALFIEGFRGGLYYCKKHYGIIFYILYSFLLAIFSMIMAILSLLNIRKSAAYMEILKIIITGQIVSKR